MQWNDVILGRRSIRGYKPGPVPRDFINEITILATKAGKQVHRSARHSARSDGNPDGSVTAPIDARSFAKTLRGGGAAGAGWLNIRR